MESPADVVPGLAVVLKEVCVTRGYDTYHVFVVCFQELDHGFRSVAFSARAAVARCHKDVRAINLFPACDFHCPGGEPVCYGLGAPGARGPVVDDRLSDNTSPLVVMFAKFYSPGNVHMQGSAQGFRACLGLEPRGDATHATVES